MKEGAEKQQLISAAISGDRIAQQRLLLGEYDWLSRHVARKFPGDLQAVVDVDDILQQTFIDVFRDIRQCEAVGEREFRAWLRTIADHRLADALKSHRRKKRGGDFRKIDQRRGSSSSYWGLLDVLSGDESTPSSRAAKKEAVHTLEVAVAALPETYRQVIELYYGNERTVDDVAAEIGCTAGAVRGRLARARSKLRASLGDTSEYYAKR